MVTSMTAAISGLRTHQSKMDVIGNNIANVNTWGYKSRSANFQDIMYKNVVQNTAGNTNEGSYGGVNASQVGFGVALGSVTTNFTAGSWGVTGDPYNAYIDGTGFYIVGPMSPNTGNIDPEDFLEENVYLSRVGIFAFDNNGYLVDNKGNYIYGFAADDPTAPDTEFEDNLGAIQVPDPYVVQSMTIDNTGVITIATTDTTQPQIKIGQIALAAVENVNGLVQTSGYLYEVGANAGEVTAVKPIGGPPVGSILQNILEMSNVDLATDISNMITTQRGYQANSKIITVTDEMLEELVNIKR